MSTDMKTAKVVETATIYNEKGLLAIPKDVRDELGIGEGDRLRFIVQDGELTTYVVED